MKTVILSPLHRPRDVAQLMDNSVRQSHRIPVIVVENGEALGCFKSLQDFNSVQDYKTVIKDFKVVSSPEVKGVGAARNACLAAAREAGADAFIFMDADDYYGPRYVDEYIRALHFLSDHGYSAIGKTQGWALLGDGLYRFPASTTTLPSGGTYAGFVQDAEPFPETIVHGEDHLWWKAMAQAGKRTFLSLNQDHYCYIRHQSNTWVLPDPLVRLGRGVADYYGRRHPNAIDKKLKPIEQRGNPSQPEISAAMKVFR